MRKFLWNFEVKLRKEREKIQKETLGNVIFWSSSKEYWRISYFFGVSIKWEQSWNIE